MERDDVETTDVEDMLKTAGDFGKFQIILIALFSVINMLSAFHYFGQTFISVEPEHRCKLQHYGNLTSVTSSRCTVTASNDSGTFVELCSQWEYNSSYGYVSLVQELDWICEDDWKATLGQSVFFVGSLIGSLGFGILADRIGRLHVLVMANMLAFIGNFVTIFSYSAVTYGLSRFLAGCATDSNFVMMYMIVMEYIRPKMRTFGLNLAIGIFYTISSMLMPWIAVLCGHWQLFLIVIALPHLSVLLFYFLVPESAQWLISKGRVDEAMERFQRIAGINGKVIPDAAVAGLRHYAKEHIGKTDSHESFLGLLRTPKLRRKTLVLIFKSMVLNLCYDAIARDVNGLAYSPFLIFTATSATILPGCVVILLLQDRVGRKALASSSLLLGGIFISVVAFILSSHTDPLLTLILTIIARLNVVVAYNSGAQYAFELIPTEVRAQGVSVIHVAGFAATFFSPQILYMSRYWKPLPEVILGALLIAGAVACLFLPETLNRSLPVTLSDGEEFGEDEGVFEFACCGQKKLTESTHILTQPPRPNRY